MQTAKYLTETSEWKFFLKILMREGENILNVHVNFNNNNKKSMVKKATLITEIKPNMNCIQNERK